MAKQNNSEMPRWVPRLIAAIFVAAFAIVAAVYLFIKLSGLISLVLIALFLSFALEPLVNRLVKRGWRRSLASGTILLGFSIAVLALVGAMIPLIISQVGEVADQGPAWAGALTAKLQDWFGLRISQTDIINQLKGADGLAANYITDITGNIVGYGKQFFVGMFQFFGILLFTYYFVADAPHLRRVICSFLPPKSQRAVLNTWELAIDKTGAYMLSRALLALISATVTFIALALLGVPFALPLALWVGVVSQVLPVIGTFLAASVPLLVALIAQPGAFLPLLIFIIVYQQIENYFFAPKVTAETMELHPAVAFGAVLAGGSVAGLVGALLALPLAAILQESTRVYLQRHELVESNLLLAPQKKHKRSATKKKQPTK